MDEREESLEVRWYLPRAAEIKENKSQASDLKTIGRTSKGVWYLRDEQLVRSIKTFGMVKMFGKIKAISNYFLLGHQHISMWVDVMLHNDLNLINLLHWRGSSYRHTSDGR